ncbi:MAG: mechanosensitive ion channel family protein, partial [Pseudomonadota bacterium]
MDAIDAFINLIARVWQGGLGGIDISSLLVAMLIFLAFIVLRRAASYVVLGTMRRLARQTKTELDDQVVDAIEAPARFVPVVMGVFFATQYLALEDVAAAFVLNISVSLVIFNLFWFFYQMVAPLSVVLGKLESVFNEEMQSWVVKAIKTVFVLVGGATILEAWGIEVGPILAGLGLFGVVVALGAQDLFKNLIAGILIMAEQRFTRGDWIRVEGVVEGHVEEIGFRSTLIRRFDKAPVYVPNTNLSDTAVTNFSSMTFRRINWVIGVEYRTSIDQLKEIRDRIEQFIVDNDEFVNPGEASTFVRVDSFNDSSIDFLVYCFTRTIVWGEWLRIKEQLALEIMKIVEESGTSFAFPSQSVYLESLPATERPEPFVPI